MLIGTSLDFADPAGQWVLGKLVDYALTAEELPPVSIPDEKLRELAVARANLILPLDGNWRFKLDPEDTGVAENWFAPALDDSSWDEIPVGSAWEASGYAYDGWAWYRRSVGIPADWEGAKVRLVAEGVDDVYGLYVNGEFVAFHGDLAKGHDEGSIWLQQTVSDVSDYIRPGEKNVIAIRVLDWTGNGGIWRPIYLTSE